MLLLKTLILPVKLVNMMLVLIAKCNFLKSQRDHGLMRLSLNNNKHKLTQMIEKHTFLIKLTEDLN
ncbi:MAG: hypothetical protein QKN94_gp5 [Narnavirus sp.]|uniref:Uncharacterized protein n=1 Tax=H4BulkLitter234 virus TaxID=2847102 RepID=A0A514DAV2_9MONO|nr:MAG: hypothetical protein QKN94_gp5 [Narnavirus sp.]QDH90732.1 MAG: hypothetical protein H4BulkLitter234_000005 [H4BulkLitter234 virus]